MRSVSTDLADAIVSGERAITARVSVDWDKDGHGGSGTLDDVTPYVQSVNVQHDLTGEVPEEVSVVEGSASSAAKIELGGGPADDDRRGAAWTFSTLNPDSPFVGKQQLARPATVDLGFKTRSGIQHMRMLTGSSRGIDVDSGPQSATLDLLDQAESLRAPIALPAIIADAPEVSGQSVMKYGLEATWLVAYVLYQSGIYVAPPPRTGCRYYAPMCGSAYPFIGAASVPKPGGYSAATDVQEAYFSVVDGSDVVKQVVEFEDDGPYLLGTARRTDGGLSLDAPLAPGANMGTAGGRAWGRLEFWFRCSTFNNGSVSAFTIRVGDTDPVSTDPFIDVNILGTSGTTGTLRLRDATGTIASGPTVTASSDWQFIGVHWDLSIPQVKFRYNGTTTTVAASGTGPIWWPTETTPFVRTTAVANSGLAEIHVTAGLAASTTFLDQDAASFTPDAVIDRSVQRLDGVVAGANASRWELLKEIAAAELALTYFDELGVYQYRTAARLAGTAAQTVQRTITADADITALAYSNQIDKVRNVVTATASNVRLVPDSEIYTTDTVITVPRRSSVVIQFPVDAAIIAVDALDFDARLATSGGGTNYRSRITTYVDVLDGRIQVRFANSGYQHLYLVDSAGDPKLIITGTVIEDAGGGASYTARDQASIDEFGEYSLDAPANRWRQRDADAGAIAARLAAELAWPRPTLSNIGIAGDPRLERGDRVKVQDVNGIGLDGDYWLTNIGSDWSAGGAFNQTVAARRARTVFEWDGIGGWDDPDSMWGA